MAFTRVLIANRGEIAVRVIRACRELGLSPIVVYSAADAAALHVRLADVAYPIGPAPAAESYLRSETLIAAALATGAEAVHPGYGFLSENAQFAHDCAAAGLIFVGPPPAAIEAMGQKIAARAIALQAGVPVVPGYNGDDQRDEVLRSQAEQIGFPLLIKASSGGGGKGMRVVHHSDEFAAALAGARREARGAFGDDTVFLERLLLRPRHIEIQVLADTHGNTVHLGERECSIQRRHQKIIEESPSPALTPALRAEMGAAAVQAARAIGYVNAGTVEFMLDEDGHYYFLEMNTRLQVEHPVTELVTGLDLVRLQFAVAAGAPLPFSQDDVTFRGHAIEVRVYAEDPVTYLPDTGRLVVCEPPTGLGVRVDTGVTTGDTVTVHYDPMLAKLIVSDSDRASAVQRLQRALDDYAILGVTTNLPLLCAIAGHPAFAAGETHTGFLEEQHVQAVGLDSVPGEVLVAAALWELLATTDTSQTATATLPSPFARRWRASGQDIPFNYTWGTETYRLWATAEAPGWRVAIERNDDLATEEFMTQAMALRSAELILIIARAQTSGPRQPQSTNPQPIERFHVARTSDSDDLLIGWRGVTYTLTRPAPLSVDSYGLHGAAHGAESLTAPMPGTLLKVLVSVGQEVHQGQPLLILEAMKMEHTVIAPCDGVVQHVPYPEGSGVANGAILIELAEHTQDGPASA